MPSHPALQVPTPLKRSCAVEEARRCLAHGAADSLAVQGSQTHREARPWKPNNTSGPKMHPAQPQIVRLEALYTPRPPESNEVRPFAV
jgi:hypothetical protein